MDVPRRNMGNTRRSIREMVKDMGVEGKKQGGYVGDNMVHLVGIWEESTSLAHIKILVSFTMI